VYCSLFLRRGHHQGGHARGFAHAERGVASGQRGRGGDHCSGDGAERETGGRETGYGHGRATRVAHAGGQGTGVDGRRRRQE